MFDKNQKLLIIVEVKSQGKDLKQALEQRIGYAKIFKTPLVVATDSIFTKCFHVSSQKNYFFYIFLLDTNLKLAGGKCGLVGNIENKIIISW